MANERTSLSIHKMPDGGFMVHEMSLFGADPNHRWCGPLFAATDISEVLTYIRQQLAPAASGK